MKGTMEAMAGGAVGAAARSLGEKFCHKLAVRDSMS